MAEYVLQAGLRMPEKPALEVLGGEVWTHADIRQAVTRLAGGLKRLGLKDGSKVLFRLGNRVEFPIAYLACIWAGLVPVPTSAQLNVAEISKIADELSPDLILTEDQIACPSQPIPSVSLDALRQMFKATPCPAVMGDPDRLAYIIFTSGTSGKPRGVCHAHRAIWARRMMFDGWYGLRESDRILHAGAFNWSYTMGTGLMDPWTLGATALIPSDGMKIEQLADAIGHSKATIFAAAPGVYRQLLKTDRLKPSPNLRHGLSAGETLAPGLRARWNSHMGCDIHEALGMSECSTFISGSPEFAAPLGTTGKAQQGRRIAIVDDQDSPCSTGTLAIHKSDPGLMIGYLGDATPAQDWFKTGDTVSICENGWITYLGRNDDMITAGGYRISPLEIEAAFDTHPDIEECAATQVQMNADTTLTALFHKAPEGIAEPDLRAHAQTLLAPYKQPRLYIACASLPKGPNGKLNRKSLRENYEANL